MNIFEFLRAKLAAEPPIHPVDRLMAKRWVKDRLKRMYPELRDNPRALEETYKALSLEPRPGAGAGGEALFEILLPGRID